MPPALEPQQLSQGHLQAHHDCNLAIAFLRRHHPDYEMAWLRAGAQSRWEPHVWRGLGLSRAMLVGQSPATLRMRFGTGGMQSSSSPQS